MAAIAEWRYLRVGGRINLHSCLSFLHSRHGPVSFLPLRSQRFCSFRHWLQDTYIRSRVVSMGGVGSGVGSLAAFWKRLAYDSLRGPAQHGISSSTQSSHLSTSFPPSFLKEQGIRFSLQAPHTRFHFGGTMNSQSQSVSEHTSQGYVWGLLISEQSSMPLRKQFLQPRLCGSSFPKSARVRPSDLQGISQNRRDKLCEYKP